MQGCLARDLFGQVVHAVILLLGLTVVVARLRGGGLAAGDVAQALVNDLVVVVGLATVQTVQLAQVWKTLKSQSI